jgi:hypothetical protein
MVLGHVLQVHGLLLPGRVLSLLLLKALFLLLLSCRQGLHALQLLLHGRHSRNCPVHASCSQNNTGKPARQ